MPLAEGCSAPFPDLGDPRIKACLRLPEAYRSLATSFVGSWCQGIPTCTRGSLTNFSLEIFITRLLFAHTRLSKSFSCTHAQERHGKPTSVSPRTRFQAARPRTRQGKRRVPQQLSPPRTARLTPHHATPLNTTPTTGAVWRRSDSNRRPPGCKPGALPVELRPRNSSRPQPASPPPLRARRT